MPGNAAHQRRAAPCANAPSCSSRSSPRRIPPSSQPCPPPSGPRPPARAASRTTSACLRHRRVQAVSPGSAVYTTKSLRDSRSWNHCGLWLPARWRPTRSARPNRASASTSRPACSARSTDSSSGTSASVRGVMTRCRSASRSSIRDTVSRASRRIACGWPRSTRSNVPAESIASSESRKARTVARRGRETMSPISPTVSPAAMRPTSSPPGP